MHAIFDKRLFPKYNNSYVKECKLYDKLLNKISPETELSVSDSSEKNEPVPVLTPHTLISLFKTILLLVLFLPSLSYKSISPLSSSRFKKPIVEIEKNVDSDIEIQLPNPQ